MHRALPLLIGAWIIGAWLPGGCLLAQEATLLSHFSRRDSSLTADPRSEPWRAIPPVETSHDRYGNPVPNATTAFRSRWTRQHLYFLFAAQFETLHLKPNPSRKETWGLWDYDVAEVFIGHDLVNMNRYKEFEVSPQEEWVDLDVDRERKGKEVDWLWNSGFRFRTRVDHEAKMWFCEMRIPWRSIDPRPPEEGNELRLNLYRIEGKEPARKYITWQPVHSPSFHTPKAFGRIRLVGESVRR